MTHVLKVIHIYNCLALLTNSSYWLHRSITIIDVGDLLIRRPWLGVRFSLKCIAVADLPFNNGHCAVTVAVDIPRWTVFPHRIRDTGSGTGANKAHS